jgi:hypothetical protein
MIVRIPLLKFWHSTVACCLKAGVSEAEQTSIDSQRFDNTSALGKEKTQDSHSQATVP